MTDLAQSRTNSTAKPRSALQGPPIPAGGVSRSWALAGFAGAALYLIGSLLPGSAPKPDASASAVLSFFVDKRGSLLVGFGLELIALAFLVWFLGQLRTLVADTSPTGAPLATAMTAAWVILITIVALSMLPAIALVWQGAASAGPGLVRMAYDMETLGTYAASSTAALVSIGIPSLVIWRNGVLPRWLALLGAVEVVINLVELIGLSSRHGALTGGYVDGVGPLLWVLWVAAASVCMVWRPRGAKEPTR